MVTNNTAIGKVMRFDITKQRLRVKALAAKINMPYSTLSKLLLQKKMNTDQIRKMSEALGKNFFIEFLTEEDRLKIMNEEIEKREVLKTMNSDKDGLIKQVSDMQQELAVCRAKIEGFELAKRN